MKDNKKYQDLFNALLIKYGIEPDEEWTNNIVWKSLIDSKLDTKQRNQFYNEFSKLELKYKDMTYNSAKVSTQEEIKEEIKEDKTKKVETEEEFKKCPYCAEDIKFAAIKCKHCGEKIKYEGTFEKVKKTSNYFEPPPSYGFFAAVVTCFRKYFVFKGRASRSEYFYFHLFSYLLIILAYSIDIYTFYGSLPNFNEIYYGYFRQRFEFGLSINIVSLLFIYIISVVLIIPLLSVTARRFHDINISGWWQLLTIPITYYWIIFEIVILGICAIRGNNHENYYDTGIRSFAPNLFFRVIWITLTVLAVVALFNYAMLVVWIRSVFG